MTGRPTAWPLDVGISCHKLLLNIKSAAIHYCHSVLLHQRAREPKCQNPKFLSTCTKLYHVELLELSIESLLLDDVAYYL